MDQRNMWIAIGLSVAIIFVFQFFLTPTPPPQPTSQQAGDTLQPSVGGNAQQPAAGSAPAASGIVRPVSEVLGESPRLKLANNKLDGSIDLKGARLDNLVLRNYHEELDRSSPLVTLLAPRGTQDPYFAAVRWLSSDGTEVPTPDTLWSVKGGQTQLAPGQPVTLTWNNGAGQTFEIDIALDDEYMFTFVQRVINLSDEAVNVAPYGLVNRTGTPQMDAAFVVHEGPVGVFNNTYEEIDYDEIFDAAGGVISQKTNDGWTGFFDKYWTVLLIPEQGAEMDARFVATLQSRTPVYQADMAYGSVNVGPGGTQEDTFRIYAGARVPNIVDAYSDDLGIAKFYLAVDYGWIFFLARPLYWVLDWFYGLVGNFGVAIMLLVVCVRILLFPLANTAFKSMAKMRKLQPKMVELRERYKDDRQKFQQEMMGLYKKEGANPVAGCLPMLLQIPIFIALYNVLYGSILMRHAPFFGWIQDLSAPDPTSYINLFGLLPFSVPDLGFFNLLSLGIWPIFMGVTMYVQYKLNPQPTDPMQARIFQLMPIVFTFMLGHFAAGLVIYWAWNNVLSMFQQVIIMKRQGIPLGGTMPSMLPASLTGGGDSKPAADPEPEPEPEEKPAKRERAQLAGRPANTLSKAERQAAAQARAAQGTTSGAKSGKRPAAKRGSGTASGSRTRSRGSSSGPSTRGKRR